MKGKCLVKKNELHSEQVLVFKEGARKKFKRQSRLSKSLPT